ncbi:MAG: hypothetical protein ACQEXO_17470 [Pseudomonadota bacterium]
MKKKVFIHIGSGKTGTSSIQSALYEYEKKGVGTVRYPVVYGKGHQSIEVLFKDFGSITRGLKQKFAKRSDYENFKKSFDTSLSECLECNNVILSSDFLFHFSFLEVADFRRYLEDKGFNDFKVVVYFREPADYYLSYVQQKIKAAHSVPSPLNFKAGYRGRLNNWLEVFGSDVCVRMFDKDFMVDGDVLQDFSALLGGFFNADVKLVGGVKVNESVSAEGMVLLQEFRRFFFFDKEDQFFKHSDFFLKKIQDIESQYPGSKPALRSCYLGKVNSLNSEFFDILNDFGLSGVSGLNREGSIVSAKDCCAHDGFSGDVFDLLRDFDERHYKFLLHKMVFDFM